MGHLRQKYLGASPQKTLCIMPYYHQRPSIPTGECIFPRMSDELLCRIFEYLAPVQHPHLGYKYGPCLRILLVCRRWERLYCSYLYRNIDIGEKVRRIKQLGTTLGQRPDLGDAVYGVGVQFWRPSIATCEMIAYILRCCRCLRKFELHTGWTQSTWIILNAVKRAPLTALKLSGFEGGPSLQMILKHFSLPTLKEVSLARYGLGNGEEPGAPWHTSTDTTHEDLKLLLSSASPCNATTMVLADPSAPAQVTRSFLQWPARLTSLTMKCMSNPAYDSGYTVDNVQPILDDHHHTLQHISLGMLAYGSRNLPDFSSFTSLESLQIHGSNLFRVSPCSAASKLKAPQLRSLGISFNTEDQHETFPDEFGPEKIGWLEDFFDHMTPGTNVLETVSIEFYPGVSLYDPDWANTDTWPWSYIDQAVGIFAAHNVAMSYTEPHISRKEWDQAVEQRNKNAIRRPP